MSLVVLENAHVNARGAAGRIFRDPAAIVECRDANGLAAALAEIEAAGRAGLYAAGFIAYEAGYQLEPKLAALMPPIDGPLLWFGLYERCEFRDARGMDAFWRAEMQPHPGITEMTAPQPEITRESYDAAVAAIAGHLAAGDIYQACFTFQLHFDLAGPPRGLYRRLRQAQRAAHGGYIETGEWQILSLSPELFLTRRGADIAVRPMKGTAKRGLDVAADAAGAAALAADEKNRAENLMIVDLLRNDLSRLALPGSVTVSAPFHVEPVGPTLTMTTDIAAKLPGDVGIADLLRALFPSGSVTGAPKIRAMEILRGLERGPRGVYCGGLGMIAPNGDADFNVAIRTVMLRGGRGQMGIGGGIVADSAAAMEYDEALLKARFLTQPWPDFALIETLRWPSDDARIGRHLARLKNSADYFGFRFDEAAARAALADHAAALADDKVWRVRCLLSAQGEISLTARPAAPPPAEIVPSDDPVDAGDVFLRHKTTNRARYNAAMAAAAPREMVFFNRAGELAEGARTNIFIEREGQLLTPPLDSGCLPGILRGELIASGRAREAVLRRADLEQAKAIYIGNAVMGLVPVRLAPQR